ncbi:MAG: flippase-like domain-containing protein, partial [Solirubrobacterales bacterium]|nr:flippase-like domain-containing protein [Solirubrobacterales bacterium]
AAMAALQAGSTACLWWLQRIAIHAPGWFAVATSQLAGNGMSKIAPGGGAVGAALQYRMLVQAGTDRSRAVAGLTAANLLVLGIVLVLPLLATPALLSGAADRDLVRISAAALGVFVVLFALGALCLALDGPLRWAGRVAQRLRNRLRPRAVPLEHLPSRLLRERDRIVRTVGPRWKAALAAGAGRWALDYASLLAALTAVGASARPGLVLLAFCGAQLLAQVPITPGGLGFVEAGLTAMLGLAGVAAADAVLATFAYRLFTYWLSLPLGLAGVVLHRRRYARGHALADG